MRGIIHEKSFEWYTYMNIVTQPIRDEVAQYNWLISSYDCNCYPDDRISYENDFTWISGSDLLSILDQHEIQFIWGVFSAFPKEIALDNILAYKLPYADGYTGFWHNPISLQHPLAVMELVPWDSSLFLLISKDDETISKFIAAFPEAKDLEEYNAEEVEK